MLKPKDVVRVNGEYETVSFVIASCNQFKIIGRDKFYDNYINNNHYISEIDKDENGNPIILRYGEDVEVRDNDMDIWYSDTFKFYDNGQFICGEDYTMYNFVRPIKDKKEDYLIEIDRKFYDAKIVEIVDKHNALAKVVMEGK